MFRVGSTKEGCTEKGRGRMGWEGRGGGLGSRGPKVPASREHRWLRGLGTWELLRRISGDARDEGSWVRLPEITIMDPIGRGPPGSHAKPVERRVILPRADSVGAMCVREERDGSGAARTVRGPSRNQSRQSELSSQVLTAEFKAPSLTGSVIRGWDQIHHWTSLSYSTLICKEATTGTPPLDSRHVQWLGGKYQYTGKHPAPDKDIREHVNKPLKCGH